MKLPALIGVAIIKACVPPTPVPQCHTNCGANVYIPSDSPLTCEQFDAAEHAVLTTYDQLDQWTYADMCTHIPGLVVKVRSDIDDAGTFTDLTRTSGHKRVYGLMFAHGTIHIGNVPLCDGAYAHEMAHWFEWSIDKLNNHTHSGWVGDGGMYEKVWAAEEAMCK